MKLFKTISVLATVVLPGLVALGVILFDLWLKSMGDRWHDPTRLPGRWLYR